MDYNTLMTGINLVFTLVNSLSIVNNTEKDKKVDAVIKLRRAINGTEAYLTTSNREFVPNDELSQMWSEAFGSMLFVDKSLSKLLEDKSRFWANPEKWLSEDGAMELIPSLKELDNKCEEILINLK